jgi:hypothetical protein
LHLLPKTKIVIVIAIDGSENDGLRNNNLAGLNVKTIYFIKSLGLLCLSFLLNGCGGGSTVPVISAPEAQLPELRILVIGQSISSNCNQHVYGPVANVYQFGLNGDIKDAKDPFEWADCSSGSMWMPLGKKLIDAGVARKVVFMPIGVSGTSVQAWQEGGVAFAKLNRALEIINQRGIEFDFAFWHQGSANSGTPADVYTESLSAVVGYVNRNVKIARWLIAVHSRCGGPADLSIEAAQLAFGNAPGLGRYLGPNTNLLGDDYRSDRCHLNEKGQEAMASMWLDSIKSAQK